MSYLEVALANARKGYPQFPTNFGLKTPKKGFNDWETNATTDEAQIKAWWDEGDWLPAIPPGRIGKAVIDVDQHPGKPSGFESIERHKIFLPETFSRPSVSGNGLHYWFSGEVGSVNGVFPGIDRKAQGGYVVVVYELPDPSEIIVPIPERLSGSTSESVERHRKSRIQLNEWLFEVGAGTPDEVMWALLEGYLPSGNEHMSKYIARVVSQAAQGHPGASVVLDGMYDKWMDVSHFSGDPEEEFKVNVRSAIEKFGEPVPEMTVDEKVRQLLNPGFYAGSLENIILALKQFCSNYRPGWEATHAGMVNVILSRVGIVMGNVKNQSDWEEAMSAIKSALRSTLDA